MAAAWLQAKEIRAEGTKADLMRQQIEAMGSDSDAESDEDFGGDSSSSEDEDGNPKPAFGSMNKFARGISCPRFSHLGVFPVIFPLCFPFLAQIFSAAKFQCNFVI